MLKEGQRDQVRMLQKNTLVRVFVPMDLETTLILLDFGLDARIGQHGREVTGRGVVNGLEIEYYLAPAIQEGTIVAQVFVKGKTLVPASTTLAQEQVAATAYPDSFNPIVSASLLSHKPDTEVLYNGQLGAEDVVKLLMVGYHPEGYRLRGNHEIMAEYSPEEFLNWYAGYKSRQAQMKSGTEPGSSRDPKKVMGRLSKPKGWDAADD